MHPPYEGEQATGRTEFKSTAASMEGSFQVSGVRKKDFGESFTWGPEVYTWDLLWVVWSTTEYLKALSRWMVRR